MTDARNTQIALEQWAAPSADARTTQIALEQWGLTTPITIRAVVTQVALEEWTPAGRPPVDLSGNLGGVSSYGKLSYGVKHYSRAGALTPGFAADLTLAGKIDLIGAIVPTFSFAGDLDVHVNLINLGGGIVPTITLGGALSLTINLAVLEGGLTPNVVLGASGLVSGPLWAQDLPSPPPWVDSEPCPPPPWMLSGPCAPVTWTPARRCNG